MIEKPRKEKKIERSDKAELLFRYIIFVFLCFRVFGRVIALCHKAFRSLMCTNLLFDVYKFVVIVYLIFLMYIT